MPLPGLCQVSAEEITKMMQLAPVPRKSPRNIGFIAAIFMDFIAAMPCGGERAASAFITNVENAKKTPPMSPQPSADNRVKVKSNLLVIIGVASISLAVSKLGPRRHRSGKCHQVRCQARATLARPRASRAVVALQAVLAHGNSSRPGTSHPASAWAIARAPPS